MPSCGPKVHLVSDSPYSVEIHWEPVAEECRNGIITKYRYCIQQTGHKRYTCTEVTDTEVTMSKVWHLKPSTTYHVTMAAGTVMGFGADSEWEMTSTLDAGNCKGKTCHICICFPNTGTGWNRYWRLR